MTLISDRIVALRKAASLTQAELAGKAGMSAPRLCRIEKGRTDPSEPEVAAIAKALRLSMSDFYKPLDQLISEPVADEAGGEG